MTQEVNLSEWTKVDSAFDFALSLPEGDQTGWIDRHFAGEPELRMRTRLLLERAMAADRLFEDLGRRRDTVFANLLPDTRTGDKDAADVRIGRHYGPWKVIRRIGAGGLAEVYEVERDDGRYDQKAALKIMRASLLGADALDLFKRERRVLASLDHPGLIRIIDGGETATGAPWLVMEHVDGVPINVWCEGLANSASLELMAQAADALQAAHARLILHGDIKPDHVVVVAESGSIKLLDFGIAQLLDDNGTGAAALAVTPAIASPEQRAGIPMTTASDIYQLGLILQQILASGTAEPRHAAVVGMALGSGTSAQYASAAELAADLRNLAAERPVMALPDSRMESAVRVIRNNRMAATLALTAVLGLIGWGVSASVYAGEIEWQRNAAVAATDRAERGRAMLLNLFRRADPLELDAAGPQPAGTLKMLDSALEDARLNLSQDPELVADLIGWTARAHHRADDLPGAQALAADSAAMILRRSGSQSSNYVSALAFQGYLQTLGDDAAGGRNTVERAMSLLGGIAVPDRHVLDALLALAWSHEGDWERQRVLFTRAMVLAQQLGQISAQVEAGAGLGRSLTGLGEHDAAQIQLDRALALAMAKYGSGHPRLALVFSDLGRLAKDRGQPELAIRHHRKALELSIEAFGPGYSRNISHRNNLATALAETDRIGEAVAQFRLLLGQTSEKSGPNSLEAGEVLQNLGAAQVRAGQFAAAESALGRADAIFAAHLPDGHPRRAFPSLTRAEMRIAQSRFAEAQADAVRALSILTAALPQGHFATEVARCRVGIALIGQGRPALARPFVQTASRTLAASTTPVLPRYIEPCRRAALGL
ncbi:MAG: tetratricopeptide repeat protein [Allopontixanthobacter sediminis]